MVEGKFMEEAFFETLNHVFKNPDEMPSHERVLEILLTFGAGRRLSTIGIQNLLHDIPKRGSYASHDALVISYMCTIDILREWLLERLSFTKFVFYQQLGHVILNYLGSNYDDFDHLLFKCTGYPKPCPINNPSFDALSAWIYSTEQQWIAGGNPLGNRSKSETFVEIASHMTRVKDYPSATAYAHIYSVEHKCIIQLDMNYRP